MKFILLIFFLVSCAGPTLRITSSSPARIEAQGQPVCEETPCEIGGYHIVDGFDSCVRGSDTRLEAFPLEKSQNSFKQSKVVFGGCGDKIDVFFDMSSGGAINTIQQQAAYNSSQSIINEKTFEEKIEMLNRLRKKNLISEDEYKSKRKEILDSIK